ncbi:hypothetical protein DCO17_02630 [Polynucleobacter tropicus]|uniref:Uncharacterized protein n=1 Tax=Polynucleobacter tropicus TaxID=1743174 RepID=A0A6M9PV96_9BURK|nr:hypothetical protein [Polynucleobacter tropicus]QKM64221.1 hypothetical protein DCO17_02630 [Polynucleobacter tropicus]
MLKHLIFILSFFWGALARAHSFDERYDLPIPLEFFLVGGGAVVAATFLMIVIAVKSWPTSWHISGSSVLVFGERMSATILFLGQLVSITLLFLVIAAGFWGPGNPLLNLAPNFIWITWWLGTSLFIALFGNIWPIINPWSALYDLLAWIGQRLGLQLKTPSPMLVFPNYLGLFWVTACLLAWSWMEVVYPIAFVPAKVASIGLIWTLLSLIGVYLFGRDVWLKRGDVFSVYFEMLGQFGIFYFQTSDRSLRIRMPGAGILLNANYWRNTPGVMAFIIAMLAIVLFDGLHGSEGWGYFISLVQHLGLSRISSSSYAMGTIGLLLVWLVFMGLFYGSCWISSCYANVSVGQLSHFFATALIPIAVAYLIAHNFSSLMIQGQSIIFLMSDPLGLGWDIFSTANFRPNIGVIDAKFTWYMAVFAIVVGHIIALVLNHLLAMRLVGSSQKATWVTLPQAVLMIMFTMLSLVIIAEPMTTSEFNPIEICFSNDAS